MLPLRARVDLRVIAMKRYSAFPKAPALLEPHHQVVQCHIQDTRLGILPLCRGAVSVFYSPSRLGNSKIRWTASIYIYIYIVFLNMHRTNGNANKSTNKMVCPFFLFQILKCHTITTITTRSLYLEQEGENIFPHDIFRDKIIQNCL